MYKLFILPLLFLTSLYGGWAEKTLSELSFQEKIGQMIVIPACPRYESDTLRATLKKYHIGAILVKQGHPLQQIPFLNTLQEEAKLPLLCTGDAEWGLGMRMEETLSFPKNAILGRHPDRIHEVGTWIGKQCHLVGIHLNFAPVVDVNNNPDNPIIGVRAFGADPQAVAQCGKAMIQGMQQGGVLTCAKHFPGHGDTDTDSHKGLPRIPHSRDHLETIEFVPFKQAIVSGVDAIMTGHLMLPALDPDVPATLSKRIVTNLLQKEWGFEGLIITDALNMKALSEHYTAGEIATQALLAGHDLLLYGAHRYDDVQGILTELIPAVIEALQKIPEEVLDRHVLKVLQMKEKLGLHQNRFTPFPDNLMDQLHPPEAITLIESIQE
ncbi:MAG: hypothetical protein KDK64_05065 [Chlamydiia bacterium]|nr:hypothetical protein [Chlamydiia bacterium]